MLTRMQDKLTLALPWAIASAFAMMAATIPADRVIFAAIFLVCCVFLVIRPHLIHYVDRAYLLAAVVFALATLAISGLNGSLSVDVRFASYPLYFVVAFVFFVAFGLTHNALREAVTGIRIGLLLATILASLEFLQTGSRIGLGANPGSAASSLLAMAIISRITVKDPYRLVPNGMWWFYLAIIPILLTGTRSALLAMALPIAYDIWRLTRIRRIHDTERKIPALAIVFVGFAVLAGTFIFGQPAFKQIYQSTMADLSDTQQSQLLLPGSFAQRMAMWKGAVSVIAEHPLLGTGNKPSMIAIRENLNGNPAIYRSYLHVHNFILDDLRSRGLIGFFVVVGFFIFIIQRIWRLGSPDIRLNIFFFFSALLVYGSMHGLMQTERSNAIIALYCILLLSHLQHSAPKNSNMTT
jgi:O-antigen ligase